MTMSVPVDSYPDYQEFLATMARTLMEMNVKRFSVGAPVELAFSAPQFLSDLFPDLRLIDFLPQNYAAYTVVVNNLNWFQRRRWYNQLRQMLILTVQMVPPAGINYSGSSFNDDIETRLRAAMRAHRNLSRDAYTITARLRIQLAELFKMCDDAANAATELVNYQRRWVHMPARYDDLKVSLTDLRVAYEKWLPAYEQMLNGQITTIKF